MTAAYFNMQTKESRHHPGGQVTNHTSVTITHLLMGPWSISWGLVGAQKTFREECDQTGDSRLVIAGWNVGKRVAVEEGHGIVGSTNMQRSSWNSPGGSILCWRLRQGQGGVAVNPLLRWELRADSYPPTGAALSPELPPSYYPLGLDTYDGVYIPTSGVRSNALLGLNSVEVCK